MKRGFQWFALGCSLHFFGAYHSYFVWLADPANRQIFHWDHGEWARALGAVVLLGALAAAGAALLRGLRPRISLATSHRLFHLYAISVAGAWLTRDYPSLSAASELVLAAAGAGVLGFLSLKRPVLLSRGLAGALLVLSPTVPVFFVHAATFAPVRAEAGRLPAAPGPAGSRVVVILFDMWDYSRVFPGGEPRAGLENLGALAAQSIVLHRAFSPRTMTLESIPRMLALKPLGVVTREHMSRGDDMAGVVSPNVFTAAGDAGAAVYLAGNHIPYAGWFGEAARYAASFSNYRFSGGPGARSFGHTLWLIARANVLLEITGISERFSARRSREITRHVLDRTHEIALSVLTMKAGRSLSFFHYPIPHSPVPLPRGAAPDRGTSTEEEYAGLLALADGKLGELMRALKDSGQWNDALVVATSDHAIPGPFGPGRIPCHVPTLIKLPGQKARIDSHVGFDLRRLRGLLTAAVAAGASADGLRAEKEIVRLLGPGKDEIKTCGPLPYPPM